MHGSTEAKGRLSLFGGFRLIIGDREIRLPSPKQRALLAYLAVSMPEPQPRSHLMTLLWGNRFEEQARLSLRQALTGLRREIGTGIIVADREMVSLVENSLDCDASPLLALADENSRESLLAASRISGEFLKGLSIEEEAFEEWLTRTRQRLANVQIDSLQALAEHELQAGRSNEAIAHLERAVRLGEYREDLHCLLMSALVVAGRRANALRHADCLAEMLKEQLGVGLSPETLELVSRIRQGDEAATIERQRTPKAFHRAAVVLPADEIEPRPQSAAGSTSIMPDNHLNGSAEHRKPPPDRPSIAVLPFANLSGDPEQEYFADGMAEDIITALSRLRWLFVIARNTSFTYKGRAVDVRAVGRGVRYVLEGSVRKDGNRVRISGQLIEAETGFHVWSDRYDSDLSGVFDLQDRVTESVVGAIEPSLRRAEIERARRKSDPELGAYDLYLRALAEMRSYSEDSYGRARPLLETAVSRDPSFAEAWASLADCIGRSALFGWIEDIDTAQRQSYDAAMKAVAADPSNGTVLALAGWACAIMAGRVEQGAEYASRAIELAPTSAVALTQCGWVFVFNGESERALECLAMARRLDPLDPKRFTAMSAIAAAHFFARRFDECIQISRRVIEEAPSLSSAWRILAASLVQKGEIEEARKVIRESLLHQPSSSLSRTAKFTRFRHSWMTDMYLGSLRRAGLPE